MFYTTFGKINCRAKYALKCSWNGPISVLYSIYEYGVHLQRFQLKWQRRVSSWPGASFQNRSYWASRVLFWDSPEDTVSSGLSQKLDEEGIALFVWERLFETRIACINFIKITKIVPEITRDCCFSCVEFRGILEVQLFKNATFLQTLLNNIASKYILTIYVTVGPKC
jgi:hypothetical protein